jgi:undecaprenyl-diphosphatase
MAAIGIVATEVFTVIIKAMMRRQRPAGDYGKFYRRTDPYSFPSGHAARAAMLCILSASLGPLPAFIVIVFWGPIMVFSRIAIGIHYVLDVLAGIALGVLLTCIILAGMPWFISLI